MLPLNVSNAVMNYHTLLFDFEEEKELLFDKSDEINPTEKEKMKTTAKDNNNNNKMVMMKWIKQKKKAMEKFGHLNPFQEKKIKRILLSYTKTNTKKTYCHVCLLEICVVLNTFLFNEEETFWIFKLCIEEIFPNYYSPPVSKDSFFALQQLSDQKNCSLSQHFQNIGFSIHFLCTKCFFRFFAECFSFEFVCRLYDLSFVEMTFSQRFAAIVYCFFFFFLFFVQIKNYFINFFWYLYVFE